MRMVSNSTADQTAGYLASKIVAGANIALSVVNPGGGESLRIDASVGEITAADITSLCSFQGFSSYTQGPKVWEQSIDAERKLISWLMYGTGSAQDPIITVPYLSAMPDGSDPTLLTFGWQTACIACDDLNYLSAPGMAFWGVNRNQINIHRDWLMGATSWTPATIRYTWGTLFARVQPGGG